MRSINPLSGLGISRCRAVCIVATIALGFAVLYGAPVPATFAQAPVRFLEIVPITHVGGPVTSIVRHGEHAYAIAGRRLIVFDVADPRAPEPVGESIDVPVGASLLAAGDGLLVLKSSPSRLVDVSDPMRPVLLGGELPIGDALSVAMRDGLIFAADGLSGLWVVDATDARVPSLIATLPVGGIARHVGLSDRRLIMNRVVDRGDPESTNALLVIDVKDPYAPRITGELALDTDSGGLAVEGARALVDGRGTVIAIDLAEEDRPRIVDEIASGLGTEPILIDGDRAWFWNFIFVRGAPSLTPILLDSWPRLETAETISLEYGARRSLISIGETVLVANGYHGLGVIGDDVAEPFPFPVLGSGGRPVVDGDRLWMADDDLELWSVDIQNPRAPVLRGAHQLWPDRRTNFAFGVDLFRFREVIGATIPTGSPYGLLETLEPGPGFAPRHLGQWVPSEETSLEPSILVGDPLVVAGDRAYVASYGTEMLHEFDLSDPAAPRLARTFDPKLERDGISVAVVGEHAWLSMYQTGIAVIDLAAPDGMLREVTRFVEPGHAVDIAAMGEYVLVADGPYGLRVIDAADPLAPRTVSRVGGFDALRVQIHGDQAWVAVDEGDEWTTRIFDVSDPVNPIEIGRYPRYLEYVAVDGGYAYAPAEDGGIEVFELRDGGEIRPPWAQVWLPSVVVQR